MTFDLVIKQGIVVDPAQKLHATRDIGIRQGKIAAVTSEIPSSEAAEQINALPAQSRFRNHVPGEPVTLTKGA